MSRSVWWHIQQSAVGCWCTHVLCAALHPRKSVGCLLSCVIVIVFSLVVDGLLGIACFVSFETFRDMVPLSTRRCRRENQRYSSYGYSFAPSVGGWRVIQLPNNQTLERTTNYSYCIVLQT